LEFQDGLTCITGETGAGKTILTQAVLLVAGGKADPSLIGAAGTEAYVEAEFDDAPPEVLESIAIRDEPLILARRLQGTRSRALCDGRSCSVTQLEEAASLLISIISQHAARQLADSRVQLDLIDEKGGLMPLRGEIAKRFQALVARQSELDGLRARLMDKERRVEILRSDIELVRSLEPKPGEEEALLVEYERLANIEFLRQAVLQAHTLLSADDGISDRLVLVVRELHAAEEHDPALAHLVDGFNETIEVLRDLSREAGSLAEDYEGDPQRLQEVEQRLADLRGLRRRFAGNELEAILQEIERAQDELEELEAGDERLEELEAELKEAHSSYNEAAARLRAQRKRVAKQLVREVESHLDDLALENARLEVAFKEVPPSAMGTERVQFLLAANPHLTATPLDKGASGGEASRVALALLLAAGARQGTWIFDEIDAGIGGQTAHVVGAKLKALAENCQVIVITHLAQVAVQATSHFAITKDAEGMARVTLLKEEGGREAELARLMGAEASQASEAAGLIRSAAG
jgi:DNA repair protein RecN (Recombination protein N)